MVQVLTAIIAATSALLGATISQLLSLKGAREQVAAQHAAQRANQAATHRQWLWEKRAAAYEAFLDPVHETTAHLKELGRLSEGPDARAAYEAAGASLEVVRRRQAAVAALGPKQVSFAAHHVHAALEMWRYIHELLMFGSEHRLDLPQDDRRYGLQLAAKVASMLMSTYTRAAQVVMSDDGTEPEKTDRLLSLLEEEVVSANEAWREHMAFLYEDPSPRFPTQPEDHEGHPPRPAS